MSLADDLQKILQFFTNVLLDLENFAESVADAVVGDAVDKLASDIDLLQGALDEAADAIPDPEPELKLHVTTLYNVEAALRDWQRDQLRSFVANRYKKLLAEFKRTYSTKVVVDVVKLIVKLEFGRAITFVLEHAVEILVGTIETKELYQALHDQLRPQLTAAPLSQANPRKWSTKRHQTRKHA